VDTAALEFPAIVARLVAGTSTPQGAALAAALEPSPRRDEVERRQALTSEALALEDLPLAGIDDVAGDAALAARGGTLQPDALRRVASTIRAAIAARAATATGVLLHEIATAIDPNLAPVADGIERAIDDEGVRDTASPELRRLRRELRAGQERVAEALGRLARTQGIQQHLQEEFVAYRSGRPVFAVKASDRRSVPGIVHGTSDSGRTVFVEPLEVVELSNAHAETVAAERHEVDRILRELSAGVGARAHDLIALVEATAQLDLAAACAQLSRGNPSVEVGDVVRLLGVRHPLLDPRVAVPIDLDLDGLRALVISGPNTGGKTVALKTLGLAALMHQAGLRPPAREATLPVFDDVLADIGDRQSIEMSLSTFSGHVANLIGMLERAGERSLVLVDEIASGTDPVEGSALAQALVARLVRQARLTVVTTHYPELKEWASRHEGAANAATALDPQTHEPLYTLTLGRPGTSHALQTAERLGLDPAVVADARTRIDPERLEIAALLAQTQAAERAAGEARDAAVEARERARARERELQRALARVEASAERERERAREEAERELAAARAELQALRDELRAARRARRESDADRALGAAADRVRSAERRFRELEPLPVLAPLAVGDPVESDVGVRGTIASISAGGAEVVGPGGQRVRIALSRLRPSRGREEAPAPAVHIHAAARADVSDELDVRGRRAQDAREAVRAFVDDAALAGLQQVRVVHGRGTGAVRDAVRDELDRHPLVVRREAESNDGATLAHLR